jgi:CHAT domain-containing protein/tetratricopeptide (TPR) repeat protein
MRRFLLPLFSLVLVTSLPNSFAQEPKPIVLTDEERALEAKALRLNADGERLLDQGDPKAALAKLRESLEIRQKLFPESKYPNGHPHLALSLNNLAFALSLTGSFDESLGYYEQALAVRQKLYPDSKYPNGHPNLAASLDVLASALLSMGSFEKALVYFERSLAMKQKLYPAARFPNGSRDLAMSMNNLGIGHQSMGAFERALSSYEQSLAMCRKLYPAEKYPAGHADLASCLGNVGASLESLGSFEKALAYDEEALAMCQKLYPLNEYPDGHPDLAVRLNNLGSLLRTMGALEKALQYHERALEMYRKLYPMSRYPNGHPHVAGSLDNVGAMHDSMRSFEKALEFLEQALAMRQKLYPASTFPNGHPDLAHSLNNIGSVLQEMGASDKAQTFHERALAMQQRLYPVSKFPDGHLYLARSLNYLGELQRAIGSYEKACEYFEQAIAIKQKLKNRAITYAPEERALTQLALLEHELSKFYFAAAVHVPSTVDSSYRAAWDEKGTVHRLLARRHIATVVQRQYSPEVRRQYELLGDVRREIARLVAKPGKDLATRDKRLAELNDEQERLERSLAKEVPALARDQELAKLQFKDLQDLLPTNTALVDLVRYEIEVKGKHSGWCYLAFVLAPGQPIRRIELKEAGPIDDAVAEWQRLIERRLEGVPDPLVRLFWQPIAKHLPSGTRTVYISPAGSLNLVPWSALPGSKPGTVLLEDFPGGIAIVPNGRFLLEQLKSPRESDVAKSLLEFGDVDYGESQWTKLPGTKRELEIIAAVAPGEKEMVRGTNATAKKLSGSLPNVRYAHLATHGYFNAAELAAEKVRLEQSLTDRLGTFQKSTVVVKNRLGFTGLVLANGEILTGLTIVDMPLEKLKLATLSACETNLGEPTSGESMGLPRAFHLAGCPNVVASLWNVNDSATAALMAKFYHEMWINKKPPIEALREAQLTIYHHPELIADFAGERGAPNQKRVLELTPEELKQSALANPQAAKRADTKLWAAFVLSGVGK